MNEHYEKKVEKGGNFERLFRQKVVWKDVEENELEREGIVIFVKVFFVDLW